MDTNFGLTRRHVLQVTAALGSVGATGLVTAKQNDSDQTRINVGYSAPSGRRAAKDRASKTIHEFAFDALTIETDEHAINGLRRRPDIRYAERDGQMETIAQTLPYGIDRIDADVAHTNGATGSGADIAIIDTGIDSLHPDLQANLGKGRSFVTTGNYPAWQDDNGHGTHCAGIADAINNSQGVVGVSTQATLHAVKVLSATGIGFTSDVAKGIEYTAEQGWDVGSLSLGGGAATVLKDACDYAYTNGVLLSAAAGNSGPCSECVTYPAAYQECLAVSATDRNDNLAEFSSTGSAVELTAPGVNVYSTYLGGTYTELSGTSMACPHVSGAAGQLMATGDTNTEARNRLDSTAEDIGLAATEQGNGLLDVAAALGFDSSENL